MCRNKTDKSAAERLADEARLKPVVVSLPPPPVPLFIRCHLSLSQSRRMLKHFVVVVDSLVARQAWLLSPKPWMASRRYRTASPETCTQLVSAEKSRQKAACIADGLGSAEATEEEPPPKERGGEEFERLVAEVERAFLSFFVVWCAVPGARVQ